MLILSRRPGEQILIGDNILITVAAIRGERVQLGFTAPADVFIIREELRSPPGGMAGPKSSERDVRPVVSE
jgi:carbon storage regulator